ADDLFAGPDVVSKISKFFLDPSIDAVYGDLVYVDAGRLDRIVRYWKSGKFQSNRFRRGWMPPHPTVYLRRQRYLDFGVYRKDFQISADYELLIRMMFKQCVKTAYLDEVIVKMRLGGKSNASMHNRLLANWEDRRAWEVNDLRPPFALQLLKPLRKLRQFWTRPKRVLA
ncbi:MAG: glycosyltransferase, partial [Pirellulaceae bacterium]|nr:glycosyltransferase [Pirellulaceae bacterium]